MNKTIFWAAFVAIIVGGFVMMNSLKNSQADVDYTYNAPVVMPIVEPAVTEEAEDITEEVLDMEIINIEEDEAAIDKVIDELENLEF